MISKDIEFEFLDDIISEIENVDKLHTKKIKANVKLLLTEHPEEYKVLLGMVFNYFQSINYTPQTIASDYMLMIRDMRKEGLYFYKHGEYRCKSQDEANVHVYSKPDVMRYYMSALLISQILWKHHFYIFIYFKKNISNYFEKNAKIRILDIGPGHGFYSFFIKQQFPEYSQIDFVDISETSLNMTKTIIGESPKLHYYLKNIFDFDESEKYDFIVLGEVLEHLDRPNEILDKLRTLLKENGVLWVTTPTNSPALDHVYYFHNRQEVTELIENCGLKVSLGVDYFAEDVDEKTALERKITDLVGLFCTN